MRCERTQASARMSVVANAIALLYSTNYSAVLKADFKKTDSTYNGYTHAEYSRCDILKNDKPKFFFYISLYNQNQYSCALITCGKAKAHEYLAKTLYCGHLDPTHTIQLGILFVCMNRDLEIYLCDCLRIVFSFAKSFSRYCWFYETDIIVDACIFCTLIRRTKAFRMGR